MKKTLIAAGIAAVMAAPAFADVSVSGKVHQQISKRDGSANTYSSDNDINFKASEDLGNGLTAFAQISLDVDGTSETGKDQKVGLKGAFGTVVFGQMEAFQEGAVQSRVTMVSDTSGGSAILESNNEQGRADGGMAYVSPTMNGFHFGVAGYTGFNNSSTGADAFEVAAFYDNGPLSLAVSQQTVKDTAPETSGDHDETNLSVAASYKLDNMKLTVMHTSTDNDGYAAASDSDDLAVKFDYTMGNNVITLGYKDDETTTGTNGTDVWAVEGVHKFSKTTSIYGAYIDRDVTDNTDKEVKIGLIHKF